MDKQRDFEKGWEENTYNIKDITGLADTLVVDWISIDEIAKEFMGDNNGH